MPYIQDITEPLISTLNYTSGLPVHKLAGHAANLEFWVGEVKHAVDVIDGYGERFRRLKEWERTAAQGGGLEWHPFRPEKPLRPGISDHELKELRRGLIESTERVLKRCFAEGLISESDLDEYSRILDLDREGLKHRERS